MYKLIEVIQRVADKYIENITLIIEKDLLTLEYMVYTNNEKDIYKTLQIEEFENKLKITFIPEKIEVITDLEGLDDIILILKKQSKVKEHTKEEIIQIKKKYIPGTKVKLIKMYDLQAPLPGTKGIINFVDDIGTIHMKWENGSSLGLVIGTDEFEIIE